MKKHFLSRLLNEKKSEIFFYIRVYISVALAAILVSIAFGMIIFVILQELSLSAVLAKIIAIAATLSGICFYFTCSTIELIKFYNKYYKKNNDTSDKIE